MASQRPSMQLRNHSHTLSRLSGSIKFKLQKNLMVDLNRRWRQKRSKKAKANPGISPAPNVPRDQPTVTGPLPEQPLILGTAPYVLGKPSKWRLCPVTYLSNHRPNNPGLLALTRGNVGGLFSVRNIDNGKHYAMEVLHIPSLGRAEYAHTFKKLKVLDKIRKHDWISNFVLQVPYYEVAQPTWWSSSTLYLHIVTEYYPHTLQDRRGYSELIGNEPLLGQIIWELLAGISYIHGRGIIHGNLEPGNVLIKSDGHCAITGFGGSFIIEDQTRPLRCSLEVIDRGEIIITPGFSAPELWVPRDGIFDFDETVDSWSLGLIISSLIVPRIDHDVRSKPAASTSVQQHYRSARLSPEDISLQMWMACCPNTVTEFVSMLCQLSEHRLRIEDAEEIAVKNGWDGQFGPPFPSQIVSSLRAPPIPHVHRKLSPLQTVEIRERVENTIRYLRLDTPQQNDEFVPNLDFKPFR